MPSSSAGIFLRSIQSADSIRIAASDARLRPISLSRKSDFLHAALAAYVAAWDSYLNGVVKEFVGLLSSPLELEYSALHDKYADFVGKSLHKFNTPNAENSRELLINCTGYDPIGDWTWPRAGLNGLQARDFLNQILKVRHSFAHGFAIPSFDWTVTKSGRRQLNEGNVVRVRQFVIHLVQVTDTGLWKHGSAYFPKKHHWKLQ